MDDEHNGICHQDQHIHDEEKQLDFHLAPPLNKTSSFWRMYAFRRDALSALPILMMESAKSIIAGRGYIKIKRPRNGGRFRVV
jgi:hypothetical protein